MKSLPKSQQVRMRRLQRRVESEQVVRVCLDAGLLSDGLLHVRGDASAKTIEDCSNFRGKALAVDHVTERGTGFVDPVMPTAFAASLVIDGKGESQGFADLVVNVVHSASDGLMVPHRNAAV